MKITRLIQMLVVVVTMVCSGCNIATTVHFNKDYSGHYTTVLDMSEALAMAAMFDTTGTMDEDQAVSELRHSIDSMGLSSIYNGISGIHNAKADVSDKGIISISFEFDNAAALEASFVTMQERAGEKAGEMDGSSMDFLPTDFLGGGKQIFRRDGKTITHGFDGGGGGEGLLGGDESGEMDMVASMVDYTINFSFDRKVKSVDAKGLTILEESPKMVKTRVDLGTLLGGGKYSIEIKTK
jgi:hypothetical protein